MCPTPKIQHMKTTLTPDFSIPGNDELTGQLRQLSQEFPLTYIFYHPAKKRNSAHLVIVAEEVSNVEIIQSRKWIRNSWDENTVLFSVISYEKMNSEYRAGNPFVTWYCQRSAAIYQSPSAKECPEINWPSFKKRFKKYSRAYYHDRNNLLNVVNRFQELGSLTGLFVSYLAVFEYDIQCLEILYTGSSFEPGNLHIRIKKLIMHIPSIEGIFVPKNGSEYYLISELEKAKETADNGDEIRLNECLFGSIAQAEEKLYQLVSDRFSELKKQIKSGALTQTISVGSGSSTKDNELAEITTQIVKIHPVEEIYLFHRTLNGEITSYFLLLIGESLGTEILNRIQHSVNSRFEGKCSVVLIGHSRSWIQTNLFYQQTFLQKIMHPGNLRFQSGQNHPSIHWENPHTPEYDDLEYYHRSAINLAAHYFVLRNNSEKDNTEGMFDLFCKSTLRIFRTLVYSKLSYLPNYLLAQNLWKLCVYSDSRLEKLEYLFEKLSGEDFFKEVAYHSRFHHDLSRLTENRLLIADEILDALLQELNTACMHTKEMNDEVE